MPGSVRCEFISGTSAKFWECVRDGNMTYVSFGKIGGVPSTSTKAHKDFWAAEAFSQKMLDSKLKGGYVKKGMAKVTRPSSAAKPKAKAAAMKVIKPAMKAATKKVAMKKTATSGKKVLSGKTICFTGALTIKRSIATSLAKFHGARVTSSVSKNTDVLVVGKDAGSKVLKGGPNMQYWTEAKFIKTVNPK